MHKLLKIDGGILAGGLASRMGGVDKGLQLVHNKPMAYWICQNLTPFVSNVIINCNRNKQAYNVLSHRLVADTLPDFPGPLAGIISLMTESDADYLLISPCDTPYLSSDFPKRMLVELVSCMTTKADTPYLLGVKAKDRYHPLHLCISTQFKDSLIDYLGQGKNRVMDWVEQHGIIWVDFSDQSHCFKNINTLTEVSAH